MTDLEVWKTGLVEAQATLNGFLESREQLDRCQRFSQWLVETYQKKQTVFSCGNGGSHCDAMHFAEEMTGRYRKDRRPLAAMALGDASHTTCVGNDYGFQYVFSRQLEALAKPGDLLICLSTSGNSENLLVAVKKAKEIGLRTVGLLGRDGGKLSSMVDLPIVIPAQTSDRIQEMHIKLLHIVIETVERKLFPEHYQN